MAITAVGCVFTAARQCLTLTGSSATTTSVSRRFSCSRPQPMHRSPPRWVIPKGNHHLERSSAFREAERGVEKTRFAMAPRRWRWGPRCWPHAWLPWARAWALSKGAIRPRYASRKMASSARTPHFSIARWPRDGKIHAPRALDAPEACPKKLTSYLMLYGDGNNHLYGGAKKHRGVTPRFPVHLAHTHSHKHVSLDTTPLRLRTPPFAITSMTSFPTNHLLTPRASSHFTKSMRYMKAKSA